MFQRKYPIESEYLTSGTKRRPGTRLDRVRFIVAHDTGNDGSTASGNVGYYERSANEVSASAHTFIDDKCIIECIPATLKTPEKAWHVRYNVTGDNIKFGDDANDAAIGVEFCYSYQKGSIDNKESYNRYVWYLAYLCYKYGLNPIKDIIGHNQLDPTRKTDPQNGLQHLGKTFGNLITDVAAEYQTCSGTNVPEYTVKTPAAAVLSNGSKGDEVMKLQIKLNKLGYKLLVDGDFGISTEQAVCSFQKTVGITVDGIVGSVTMASIDAKVAALANALVQEDKETEDKEELKLSKWQTDTLVETLSALKNAGKFESQEWIDKAKNGTLTVSELTFLNTILIQKVGK